VTDGYFAQTQLESPKDYMLYAVKANAGLLSCWFFVGLARMGICCYLVFVVKLITD
jgi:hypothetical protein